MSNINKPGASAVINGSLGVNRPLMQAARELNLALCVDAAHASVVEVVCLYYSNDLNFNVNYCYYRLFNTIHLDGNTPIAPDTEKGAAESSV